MVITRDTVFFEKLILQIEPTGEQKGWHMKKDVLILCQYFYPEYVSSAVLPTELAEELVNRGLTVDVLCGYPYEYYDGADVAVQETYRGIGIRRVRYSRFDKGRPIARLVNYLSLLLSFTLRFGKFFEYRCIIVYSNPPILPLLPYYVSRWSTTKFVFVAYDIYPDVALKQGIMKQGGFIDRLMRSINRRVYGQASRVVALGKEMRDYMIRTGIAEKPDHIRVIPNWYSGNSLETRDISGGEFRYLRERWPFIVLYSGNMGTCQDMDTILECMSEFRNRDDILFVFTGHGNKHSYVKDYLRDGGFKNAKVYGFLLGEDYYDVLNMADICLVSLAKGNEGLGVPSKTYGYLAAGKPVLAIMADDTDISRYLKQYGAGGNVRQGDVSGLRTLILRYLEDRELLMQSSKNAKRLFSELYERAKCTEQYYHMIMELLG